MKLKIGLLALIFCLFMLPMVAGAESGAQTEEAGFTFTDISIIIMIIIVTIYFAALFVKEWRQVR